MKIAIVGSRDFDGSYIPVRKILQRNKSLYGDRIIVVTGGSGVVDNNALNVAIEIGLRVIIIPANWGKYGTKAGPIRNAEIVRMSEVIYAFWDGRSRGTENVITLAKSTGKKIVIRRAKE